MKSRNTRRAAYKLIIFIFSLTPFLLLVNDALMERLGANPIETLHFRLGDWAIRFLCVTLALRPIKILTGQTWPLRYSRMMGLFTFFYASMHFLVYIVLDLSLSWEQFIDEIPKSPYVLVGLLAYLMLIPLAATSTKKMQKRLGRNWKKLHRLVYVVAFAVIIHYFWLVKSDLREPLLYAVIISLLLGVRIAEFARKKRISAGIAAGDPLTAASKK